MDDAFLTIEEVLLRIIEKLPHAAEAELTHLRDSVREHFANHVEDVPETTPETEKENDNAPADNPPVA